MTDRFYALVSGGEQLVLNSGAGQIAPFFSSKELARAFAGLMGSKPRAFTADGFVLQLRHLLSRGVLLYTLDPNGRAGDGGSARTDSIRGLLADVGAAP
jgi:hypothetical protein